MCYFFGVDGGSDSFRMQLIALSSDVLNFFFFFCCLYKCNLVTKSGVFWLLTEIWYFIDSALIMDYTRDT